MMVLGALAALLIAALLAAATCGWLLAGQALWRPRQAPRSGLDAQAALRRHPAGRALEERAGSSLTAGAGLVPVPGPSLPAGPEDDPEFIKALERLIHGDGPDRPG